MITNYVTGASGFIGSHLMKRLAGENTVAIPHEQIESTKLQPFKNFFYLSSYGNMVHHTDEHEIIKANVTQLVSVLNQRIRLDAGFGRFVFVSTSSVNLSVQTVYSRCKRAAEEIILSLSCEFSPMAIVRPYSVTGVGEQSEHLIPRLIRSCMEKVEIPFCESPTHDFIDVGDVVSGLLFVAESGSQGVFELGLGLCVTNQTVRELVEEATCRKALVRPMEPRNYDTVNWNEGGRRGQLVYTTPRKPLADSIGEMVEAYKNERAGKTNR